MYGRCGRKSAGPRLGSGSRGSVVEGRGVVGVSIGIARGVFLVVEVVVEVLLLLLLLL